MKLDRKEILSALETITIAGEGKNMVESGAVKNVLIFGNEVTVDLLIATPAMHIKKRAEDDIRKLIHEKFSPDVVVKVNIKVETPTQNPNEIKGKAIPGISDCQGRRFSEIQAARMPHPHQKRETTHRIMGNRL
jgi:ATP-binding protein involved in chromosome partitioning